MTDRDAMVAARQRLSEAIEGERADWHTVEVRPDDLRAVLGSEDYIIPDGAGDGLRASMQREIDSGWAVDEVLRRHGIRAPMGHSDD